VKVLRNTGRDELSHIAPELCAKQAEKVRLGYENDAAHALRQPTVFEELGELVRKVHGGSLVTRIPPIRRVAPLGVAVEIPLWARFQVVVLETARGVVDTLEDVELMSLVLE
jgi:hypothetical protein